MEENKKRIVKLNAQLLEALKTSVDLLRLAEKRTQAQDDFLSVALRLIARVENEKEAL
jgi:hypothetical protein